MIWAENKKVSMQRHSEVVQLPTFLYEQDIGDISVLLVKQ